jgi:hypothetical protein
MNIKLVNVSGFVGEILMRWLIGDEKSEVD